MRSNPYQQENLRHGAFHYLMGRGAAGAAGFFTILLLVRYMDLPNYAAYIALSGVATICGVLAGLGMERIISRYVPEARLYRSADELGRFIWITSAVKFLVALVIVALLYVFWPAIDRFLVVTDFKIFSVALVFFIVAETMFQHFSAILQSLVMQKMLTRLLVMQWAGRLLLIAVVIYLKSQIDWQDSLWIFAIPELLGVICFIVVIRQHLHRLHVEHHEVMTGSWPQWNKVARVGLHNYGFTLLAAPPQGYFMKVLTAAFLPIEVVAAYGFFLSVAEKARQYIPLHFFYNMLEPMMIAGYLKNRDYSELSYRCQLLYKSNLLLMVPAIAWVAVAGDAIVGLMTGGKFQGLSWILVMVMVQLTIGSHVVLLQLLLNSLEKSKILLVASVFALVGMLLAMALAVITSPMWLLCAPILFSLIMNLYIVVRLARSNHSYQPSWKMLGGVSFSGLAAFAAVKLMTLVMPSDGNLLLTAITTLMGITIVYAVMIWVLKAIDTSEINLLKNLIRSMRRSKAETPGDTQSPTVSKDSTSPILSPEDIWGGRLLINQLQGVARTILNPLIPNGSSVALLDYPNNPNVGDSLIWLGEIAYLKSRNVKLAYTCDARNFNRDELAAALDKDTIILIHGGGNFGTLWPEEQQFRLRVLREFPGRQIIQLSQSIHFDDPLAVAETAQAIRAHGNYTLLARDQASFDFASAHFECKVILCPDMAFFIGALESNQIAQCDRFILSRTDHEKSGNWLAGLQDMQQEASVDVSDWLKASWYERFLVRIGQHTAIMRRIIDPNNKALFFMWNHLARQRLKRGRGLLERGKVVISDRLHAHILAVLLNKPHAVIDNANRKISGLHQTWTMPYQGVAFVNDIQEAFSVAAEFDCKMSRRHAPKAVPSALAPSLKKCVVVTCFSENQPGYLDFSYRIKSLAGMYDLTILSQDPLTQAELQVSAGYVVMGRRHGKLGWLGYLWQCASYVRKHRPAVLVLMHSSASPITLLVGKIPVCLYWNEHPTNLIHLPEKFSPLRHFLAIASHRLVFLGARRADLVMPIGEAHRDDLLANGCRSERMKLTYMGVADIFRAEPRATNAAPLELIYIGTISVPRGRDVMLEGLAQARQAGHHVRLTMVGADEEQLAYCRHKAAQLGLQDCVRILGRVPGSEIPALLAQADLGICLWEDQPWWRFNPPTKLFEYLAAGLPVLASDIRTHTRYVQHGNNGLIFEYGAPGFAAVIAELVAGKDKLDEMKRNAYRSGQPYLWSRIEPAFLDNVAGLVSA